MMRRLFLLIAGCFAMTAPLAAEKPAAEKPHWGIVIHGGAGQLERDKITPEKDAAVRAALDLALQAGGAILAKGGSSLDAVQAAVMVLEDDPNFNAGRGAVLS